MCKSQATPKMGPYETTLQYPREETFGGACAACGREREERSDWQAEVALLWRKKCLAESLTRTRSCFT